MAKSVLCVKEGQFEPIPIGKAVKCAAQVVERVRAQQGSRLGLRKEDIHIDALAEIGGTIQIFLRRIHRQISRHSSNMPVFSCRMWEMSPNE